MSPELVSILVLIVMFAIATIWRINMGVLAFVAAFAVGVAYTDLAGDEIAELFPGDLFVLLVGITFLFAIAQNNGTIDWIVAAAVRAVGGRLVAIPVDHVRGQDEPEGESAGTLTRERAWTLVGLVVLASIAT